MPARVVAPTSVNGG
eukprot:ctg_7345.g677